MRLCARWSQPLAIAGSPRNKRLSAASQAAIRAAEPLSPRSRYSRYARSRASKVSGSSSSMFPTQPIPSSASGVSPSAKASSNQDLAVSQSPSLSAAQPASSGVARTNRVDVGLRYVDDGDDLGSTELRLRARLQELGYEVERRPPSE